MDGICKFTVLGKNYILHLSNFVLLLLFVSRTPMSTGNKPGKGRWRSGSLQRNVAISASPGFPTSAGLWASSNTTPRSTGCSCAYRSTVKMIFCRYRRGRVAKLIDLLNKTGRYRFMEYVRKLGEGGFGIVAKVKLDSNGQVTFLAVKMVKSSKHKHTKDSEMLAFVVQNSAFIVKLLSVHQTKSIIYFIMEYIHGMTLDKVMIKSKGIKVKKLNVLFYASQLVLGILYLHKHHIIHRDIKLKNIMISVCDHLKIIDMGICKGFFDDPGNSYVSNFFSAPELIQMRTYDFTCDWFSFGVVLYVMLEGEFLPFNGIRVKDYYENCRAGAMNVFKGMKDSESNICRNLLAFRCNNRLGHGKTEEQDIMGHPFFECVDWTRVTLEAHTCNCQRETMVITNNQ